MNRPPPPLGRTMFHRRSHKEVEYQQRKNRENCDAFSPRPSIGGESADGESARARVFCSRRRILSLGVSLDSRLHQTKRPQCRIFLEFPLSPPETQRERERLRRR